MSITFSQIPTNIRVPGTYIEVNSTASGSSGQNQRIMVLGQRKTGGTVAALTPTLVTSYTQAVDAFGAGSMLAGMFKVLFDNNADTEKWAIALDDDAGGTAAAGTVTVTASANTAGTISLYLGGVLVSVATTAGQAQNSIATAIAAAVNANNELPITASATTNVVTLTYDHKGTVGNSFDVRVNYLGSGNGESIPGGVSLAIVQPTGGATDPLVSTAWAVMPDEVFQYIVIPYNDSTNLGAATTEMDSRWGATRMLDGHVFSATKGSVSTVGTAGNARNSAHLTLIDAGNNSPTPPYIWSAATVGRVAAQASSDPALPFNGLELRDVLSPPQANRRTQSERNTLLYDGVATNYIGNDGKAYIERLTTTYQLSGVGLPDATYLDANTVFTLSFFKQDLRNHLSSRFPRFKLADDGTNTAAGSNVVTPSIIKAEIVAKAQEWFADGLLEDIAGFIETIVVERDAQDPTRVNVITMPNLVNQLQIIAVRVEFSL